ncbi:MAG: MG2 domain-containing protein [Pyrinomonadaceae bacterium]
MTTNRFPNHPARGVKIVVIYLSIIAAVFLFTTLRMRAEAKRAAEQPEPEATYETERNPNAKPYFSLSTHRTYATSEKARFWIDYQGVDHLDFRVYRVKDPVKFFKQLDDPHQMGERETEEVAQTLPKKRSWLERLRDVKTSVFDYIKEYVRAQLQHDNRKSFNQKFRKEEEVPSTRLPLNVADYARVPLLNPDQLVSSWREMLPPLAYEYDRRMIPLGKRDAGVYLVEAVGASDLRAYSIVVVTDLTMVYKTMHDNQIMVYSVDRATGAPRPNTSIEIVNGKKTIATGTTDKQGILRASVKEEKKEETTDEASGDEANADEAVDETDESVDSSYLVMATERDNFAISDLDSYYFQQGESGDGSGELTSYIYSERPVYRPEQKVYFKGILRQLGEKGYQMVGERTVTVSIETPDGETLLNKDLPLSSRGTFNGTVDLPEEAALGMYHINAQVGDATATGYFQVEEYKKPEYKVTVKTPQKFAPVGEHTKFIVEGRYFFGAPVSNADVTFYIYRSRYYAWPRDEESDADETDTGDDTEESGYAQYGYGDNMVKEGSGKLDAHGRMDVDFEVPQPDEKDNWDYTYQLEAQVTDASRRTMSGSAEFTGTRGKTVVTIDPDRYVYARGENAQIQVRTSDYEGHPVSASVTLKFSNGHWEKITKKTDEGYDDVSYELREQELSSAVVTTNAQGEATYTYNSPNAGSIYIKALIDDGGKQIVFNGNSIWVTDNSLEVSEYFDSDTDTTSIKLITDKKSYKAGETAHVLAMLPTDKAHLLVTTEQRSVLTLRNIDVEGRAALIDVPIEARYAPNVFLNVTYVKNSEMYTNDHILVVPARDKMLNVEIVPNKTEYKPRETASYTVIARNLDGSPASGAEVSLGVVDEAIYSIEPESVGNIRKEFYGRRYNEVETHLAVNYTFTGYSGDKPMTLAQNKKAYQLADFKNESPMVEPVVRKLFKDTAFWQPNLLTGADGKATVKVELPDNLTTWRATARAVTADTRVGSSTSKVVERKNLLIRLETPRFLTEGDTVTLSGIVHNYLKSDKNAQISLDAPGLQLLSPASQNALIEKDGEHRVDWRVVVPRAGELKLLAKALTDTESDAVEIPLEVVPRGIRQNKSESQTITDEDADKTVSIDLPNGASENARTLRIEASPSVASTLFGALDYLTGYPYGCTEQTMSQFLPNIIVAQTLKEVQTSSIRESNDLDRKVQKGLKRLYAYQHEDGGWGWWKNDSTDPFMTAYVVDGLTMAQRAGYAVNEDRLKRGREKLKAMLDSGANEKGDKVDMESRAYMIYALSESGQLEDKYVSELYSQRTNLQPYGRALLALTLKQRRDADRAREVASEIESSARVDNSFAHWESKRREMLDFSETNDIEATALSLKALSQITPRSQLLAKTARWLVSNRRQGYYWSSTKDTAFAIYGLIDYLKVSDELSPDYSLEVYLNGEQIMTRTFTGEDAKSAQTISISRKNGEFSNSNQLRIVKHGRGTLYLSTSLKYYTGEAETAARGSSALSITRDYLRLRIEQDEYKMKWVLEPLTGEVHSGDLIVARLHVQGAAALHLMIEDPIPAGCEQLEDVGGLNLDYTDGKWTDWYSSREFRDQRTVLFLDRFDGDATFQYAMRVQVPGDFRIAPSHAELMYQTDVQANTSSGKMQILDRN